MDNLERSQKVEDGKLTTFWALMSLEADLRKEFAELTRLRGIVDMYLLRPVERTPWGATTRITYPICEEIGYVSKHADGPSVSIRFSGCSFDPPTEVWRDGDFLIRGERSAANISVRRAYHVPTGKMWINSEREHVQSASFRARWEAAKALIATVGQTPGGGPLILLGTPDDWSETTGLSDWVDAKPWVATA